MTLLTTILLSCNLVHGKVDTSSCVKVEEDRRERLEFINTEKKRDANVTIVNISGGSNKVDVHNNRH